MFLKSLSLVKINEDLNRTLEENNFTIAILALKRFIYHGIQRQHIHNC